MKFKKESIENFLDLYDLYRKISLDDKNFVEKNGWYPEAVYYCNNLHFYTDDNYNKFMTWLRENMTDLYVVWNCTVLVFKSRDDAAFVLLTWSGSGVL